MAIKRICPLFMIALVLASCQFNNPFDEDTVCPAPTFEPKGNTYYNNVLLQLSVNNPQVKIKYSFDDQSFNHPYMGPVQLPPLGKEKEVEVWAKAVADQNSSEAVKQTYIFKAGTPVFSLDASHDHEGIQTLTLTCVTEGATIYYTTDNTEPNTTSSPYTGPISLATSTTVKAMAYKQGFHDSDPATKTYTIFGTVGTPVINPPGGTYGSPQNVSITVSTQGALIHYTTDGSEPTINSAAYTAPIYISSHTTLKACAYKDGWQNSPVVTAVYILGPMNEDFESGSFSAHPWVNNSPQPWTVTGGAYLGNYCARSGFIPHSSQTSLQISHQGNAGHVSFYRKVSSSPSFDYLVFYVDNVEKGRWSGEMAWIQYSFPVTAGNHTYKWTYIKNGSGTWGLDCAWIDNIYIP